MSTPASPFNPSRQVERIHSDRSQGQRVHALRGFREGGMRDMGLTIGTPIKVRGRAPLYDPVALKLPGYTLTLRNREADYIEVEVEN